MRPSTTQHGQLWLTNFAASDRATARMLVDGLRFASTTRIRNDLRQLLDELVSLGRIRTPAMLVPALSIEDLPKHSADGRHVAFQTFLPGDPISATPGSEGFVGNLLRDLLRSGASAWLPPTTDLETLKTTRCRSIVVVTDYAGSGRQLNDYALTFLRHPTIRSWRSGGLLRIHAVAFAATASAVESLEAPGSPVDRVSATETASTFDDRPWTSAQRTRIEELCVRYTPRRRKFEALGHRGSRGLFATDTSVPNNLPYVLRRPSNGWHAFFDGRVVPGPLANELIDHVPSLSRSELSVLSGQARLARNLESRATRPSTVALLQVLALLSRRSRTSAAISGMTGRTTANVEEILRALRTLGMVDAQGDVTSAGWREIAAAKGARRGVTTTPHGSTSSYYPRDLR